LREAAEYSDVARRHLEGISEDGPGEGATATLGVFANLGGSPDSVS
jgi:hypothetical protein